MQIGEKIKYERERNDISQGELATLLKTTQQTVSNWENNKTYPNVEFIILLSAIFQVPVEDLLEDDIEIMSKALKQKIPKRQPTTAQSKKGYWMCAMLFFLIGFSFAKSIKTH